MSILRRLSGRGSRLLIPVLGMCALMLLLKPYNRAKLQLGRDLYGFADQSNAPSHVTDYGGVLDMVSDSFAQAELTVREQMILHVKAGRKTGGDAKVYLFVNGYVEDSVVLGTKLQRVKLKVLKNDYVKFKLIGANSIVTLKLERSNGATQLAIYALIVLAILLMYLSAGRLSILDQVIPFAWLLTMFYNEHLFPDGGWFVPMSGFLLLYGTLLYVKQGFHLLRPKWVSVSSLAALDLLLAVCTVINAGFIWNYKRFNTRIDYDSVVAFLQSNLSEVLEFGANELGFVFWLILVIGVGLPVILQLINTRQQQQFRAVPLLVFLLLGLGLTAQSKYVTTFYEGYTDYYAEIAKFNKVQERFNQPKQIEASKVQQGETYVVVIGESHSKEHMSLYGYYRKTTPNLDGLSRSDQFTSFDKAFSSHTHTILVLQHALTQANQYNGLKYTEVPSVMNVLNAAGFETVWLSNQVKLSNWDNVVSAIAMGCDREIYINRNIGEKIDGGPVDEALLPILEKELNTSPAQNKVVFVHLMGSHGRYDQRYPESFSNLPSEGKGSYGTKAPAAQWEAYDNSVRYNDSICHEIIKTLDASPAKVKAMVYMADHGEDLSEGRGHNAGQFTYRMTQIPFYTWHSEAYAETYPSVVKAMGSQASYWSSDLLYDFILSLSQVETPFRSPQYDFLSENFHIDTLKTKAGSKLYASEENPYWATKINVKEASQASTNIGVHRVNSLGKLNEVIRAKLGVIELDVYIQDDGTVEVGHGEADAMSGIELTRFLESTDLEKLDMLWLDVKNLSPQKMPYLIETLSRLTIDKSKLLVETTQTDAYIKTLSDAGYRLSLYLNTAMLRTQPEARAEYLTFVNRLLRQNWLKEISFDVAFYETVRNGLSPSLRSTIKMHAWDLGLDVRHGAFLSQLNTRSYMMHKDLETLLVSFPSVFDL